MAQQTHSSSVGTVTDCARSGFGFGSLFRSFVCLLFGIPMLGGGLFLLGTIGWFSIFPPERTDPTPQPAADGSFVDVLLPVVIVLVALLALTLAGWCICMTGIKRFREAFDRRLYLRVGLGGISICVPGKSKSLSPRYPLTKRDIRWEDVTKLTFHYFAQFWETIGCDDIELIAKGGYIGIQTRYFMEDARTIRTNMEKVAERCVKKHV